MRIIRMTLVNRGFWNKKIMRAMFSIVYCSYVSDGCFGRAEAPNLLCITHLVLVPPLVAIVLALSKEVYSSLAIGLIFGRYVGIPGLTLRTEAVFEQGMVSVLSSSPV